MSESNGAVLDVNENDFDAKVDTSLAGKLTTWARKIPIKGQEWVSAIKRGQNSMTTETINTSIKNFYEHRTQ